MRGHPDVDLTEARFETFFVFPKELPGLRSIRHIDEHTSQLIPIGLSLMFPESENNLRFRRDGTESLL